MAKTVEAMEYITPLREGGSLPAVVEASDRELYVMKFRGAGQGAKALIAEWISGEIGRALGLRVPELAFMVLDGAFGKSEPNPEIQHILRTSVGLNLGLRYLSHAAEYDPLLEPAPDPLLASSIVWFDAYVTNVDRTPRNTNILLWEGDLWLIDHGATLYFHHAASDYVSRSRAPFPFIKEHVLIPFASALREADATLRSRLDLPLIREIVDRVPEAWLNDSRAFPDHRAHREAYVAYLWQRLEASSAFTEEAILARAKLL